MGPASRQPATSDDPTRERQLEQAEQLRLLVEHTPAAVALLDRELRYLVVSDRFASDYHLTSRDLVGRSHYEVFPDIPPRWREVHRRCLQGAVERCEEDPFPRADGTLDWVRWEIRPWRRGDGAIGGLVLFSEVITERKLADDRLAAERERLAVTLQSIGDAVIATDPRGRITLTNPAAETLTGWPSAEALGRPLEEVFHIVDELTMEQVESPVVKVLREGGVVALANHTSLIARDGSVRAIADSGAPIRDGDGQLRGVVMVFRDQTRERAVEAAAREASARERFAARLGDALRPLSDPVEVQGTAAQVLGEHLSACRVHYAEVIEGGSVGVVHRDYCHACPSVAGRHRFDDYGPTVMGEFRAGRTLVVSDIASDPRLTPDERARTLALGVGAYVILPLIKGGSAAAVLVVHHPGAHAYSERELAAIRETAERTWAEVERARAEAALRERERTLRTVLDTALDGYWLSDEEGRLIDVNPAYCAMSGYSRAELLTLRIGDLVADMTAEQIAARLERIRRLGAKRFEGRHRRSDGRVIDVESSVSYAADRGVFICFMRDVSEQRRAEAERRESEERLATVVRVTLTGHLVVRRHDLRILDANDAWLRMFGWPREQVLGRTTEELGLYSLDGGAELRAQLLGRIDAEGQVATQEARLRRRSGEVGDFLISSLPAELRGECCFVGAFHDVTEWRRADRARAEAERMAEAGLRASEARFRAMIEKSSDMILLLDAEGRYRFWSPSATEALGWAAEEVIGRTAFEFIHPDDAEAVKASLGQLTAAPGAVARVSMRFRHRDGSWRNIEGVGRNLLDDPAVGAIVANARDVTEQRQLEEQYRQAQKLESVGRLAGGVAHDFNNLLTVILSVGEVLKDDCQRGAVPSLDDVEELCSAGVRASELTRQLLAFARKQVIRPVLLDLNAVLRGSQKLLQRVLGEDVDLVVKEGAALWPTLCDRGLLEQVLLNLAVNARDAMPSGGRLVLETENGETDERDLRLDPDHPQGQWVRLRVRDTGTGMGPEVRAHLFEPFFTTKEVGRGTGLGLATVHGIVAQSGGHLHVQSAPGEGTTFEVCLPRASGEQVEEHELAPVPSRRGSETLLLLEDEASVRAVAVRALEGAGYRLLVASTGDEALSLVERYRGDIDLVISDVVLPDISGREVVEAILAARPRVRALYVSGYTRDEIAQRGVADSGAWFLSKPFTPTILTARVREVLDAPRFARQGGKPG